MPEHLRFSERAMRDRARDMQDSADPDVAKLATDLVTLLDRVERQRAAVQDNHRQWVSEYGELMAHLQSDEFIDAAFWPFGPTPTPEIRALAHENVSRAIAAWLTCDGATPGRPGEGA